MILACSIHEQSTADVQAALLLRFGSILHIDVCLYAFSEKSSRALSQHGLRTLATIFMNRAG